MSRRLSTQLWSPSHTSTCGTTYAVTCVGRVVAGEPEMEEALGDALEVIGGHAELQLSKAEKVNKDKLAQVGPPVAPSLL